MTKKPSEVFHTAGDVPKEGPSETQPLTVRFHAGIYWKAKNYGIDIPEVCRIALKRAVILLEEQAQLDRRKDSGGHL